LAGVISDLNENFENYVIRAQLEAGMYLYRYKVGSRGFLNPDEKAVGYPCHELIVVDPKAPSPKKQRVVI